MSQRSNYSLEEAMLIPISLCRGENTTQDCCGALTKKNSRTLVADLLTCAGADHVIVSLLNSVPTNGTGTKVSLLEGALSTAGKIFSATIFSESANRSSNILAFPSEGSPRAPAGGAVLAIAIPTHLEFLLLYVIFNLE